ncbi:hypothetical protein Hdeb2414_s0002g00059241 [Helianthus debilis subsp. tardiflorus]
MFMVASNCLVSINLLLFNKILIMPIFFFLYYVILYFANRSILAVEDIDCSAELHDREGSNAVTGNRPRGYRQQHRLTLSGFLNFIDGLWSSVVMKESLCSRQTEKRNWTLHCFVLVYGCSHQHVVLHPMWV